MIASITPTGHIVFNTPKHDPWDWIAMMRDAFPNTYIGCYDGYENCLWFSKYSLD